MTIKVNRDKFWILQLKEKQQNIFDWFEFLTHAVIKRLSCLDTYSMYDHRSTNPDGFGPITCSHWVVRLRYFEIKIEGRGLRLFSVLIFLIYYSF